MKISELSRRSGVSLPSIKFYLREGLLPPGKATGVNQADYGESHLARLALIRVLLDVAGLSVGASRAVLAVIDSPQKDALPAFRVAFEALSKRSHASAAGEEGIWKVAEREVDALLEEYAWESDAEGNPRLDLIDSLAALRSVWANCEPDEPLRLYAQAANDLAAQEVASIAETLRGDPAEALRVALMGTVLLEPVLLSLRRLALMALTRKLLAERAP